MNNKLNKTNPAPAESQGDNVLCKCGHKRKNHHWKGDRLFCNDFNCPCRQFDLPSAPPPEEPVGDRMMHYHEPFTCEEVHCDGFGGDTQDGGEVERPLRGEFRISNGHLISGSIRVMREDFDTMPHPEFKAQVFDWIVQKLNAPGTAPLTAEIERLRIWETQICEFLGSVNTVGFEEWHGHYEDGKFWIFDGEGNGLWSGATLVDAIRGMIAANPMEDNDAAQ